MRTKSAVAPKFRRVVAWMMLVSLGGCGEGSRAPALSAEPQPQRKAPAAPVAEVTLATREVEIAVAGAELEMVTCTLSPGATGPTATCPRGELSCTSLTGAITSATAVERVLLCKDGERFQFLVLSSATQLHAVQELELGDCGTPPELSLELVSVVSDTPKDISVRMKNCWSPGELTSWDRVYRWMNEGMVEIAQSELRCAELADTATDTGGDTGGGGGSGYECVGGHLMLGSGAWPVQIEKVGCSECELSDPDDRAAPALSPVLSTLRWDPSAARYVEVPRPAGP